MRKIRDIENMVKQWVADFSRVKELLEIVLGGGEGQTVGSLKISHGKDEVHENKNV